LAGLLVFLAGLRPIVFRIALTASIVVISYHLSFLASWECFLRISTNRASSSATFSR
jgi:hypothetical protein